MIYEATSFECSRIAQDLQIRKVQVESVVQLFNEGNTVPFITRYRKERTGGLDEDAIRAIQNRLNFLKQLNERKQTILKSVESQGKLTEKMRREIVNAPTARRLEDLYLPFKAKKKSLAAPAREKGLEPLALAIWHSDPVVGNLEELWPSLVNPEKQLNSMEDVKTGVMHILAEMINETAEVRALVRRTLWKTANVTSAKSEKVHEGQGNEYKPYFTFKEPAQDIRPHRILALNRGEKDGVLKVKLEWSAEVIAKAARGALAEHLLEMAGKPVPAPSQPPMPATPEPPAPTPTAPPVPVPTTPPAPAAPTAPPETPASPPPESPPVTPQPEMVAALAETPPSPPSETPSASEVPAAPTPNEMPPAQTPPTFPSPHATPLVESLSTEVKPALTGEPLAEGADFRSPHVAFLNACLDDAMNRLLLPGLEREIRTELTDEAELHAVKVCAHNVRSLLMQPPLVGRRVLGIDPSFRTGCRLAALDETGCLLEHTVIFPHGGPGGGKKKDKKPKEQPVAAVAPAATATSPPAGATPTTMEAPVPTPALADATTPTPEMGPVAEAIPSAVPNGVSSAPAIAEPSPMVANGTSAPPADAVTPTVPEAPAAPEAPAVDKRAEAKVKLIDFAKKHNVNVIALGNGGACRDTEEIIADVITSVLPELAYAIVSEAGASAYSVSPIAKEELPNLDATIRTAASIGRRLQDPLSELVKVDPQSLGVGLYPHDANRKELKESLEAVIESCVNLVGVDVNTASAPILRYVSGMNQLVAREIVEHRKNHGPFTAREQLASVIGMGPTRYAQAVAFLRIPNATNPLDRTWIHPEAYPLVEKIFAELGVTAAVFDDQEAHKAFRDKLNDVRLPELAKKLEVSEPQLDELFMALARPGRDPRQDLAAPIFKKGILKLEELQPGQELKGTVLNVVDFGAFVDVGLKDSGLVHISQMANKYIKSPYDVVSVNDIVKVWVLKIDKDSNHVSLTMIQPGSERKPGERPPRREGERPPQERDQRPSRGRSPGGPPREGQREGHGQRPGGRPPQRRGGPPRQGHGAPREHEPTLPPPPPPPPRKPRRETPKPKLTKAAMEGKAPLRTLGELAAFFEAKERKEETPPVVEEKKEETPTAPPFAEEKKEEAPPPTETPPATDVPPNPTPPESTGGDAPAS